MTKKDVLDRIHNMLSYLSSFTFSIYDDNRLYLMINLYRDSDIIYIGYIENNEYHMMDAKYLKKDLLEKIHDKMAKKYNGYS